MDVKGEHREQAATRIARMRKPMVGPALIIVCLLHSTLAALGGVPVWKAALADGWIGAFMGTERQMVLWFLMTGLVGMVAGSAIVVVERQQRFPWAVSVPLAVVAVVGVAALPKSGFWLVLGVGVLGLIRSAQPRRKVKNHHATAVSRSALSLRRRRSSTTASGMQGARRPLATNSTFAPTGGHSWLLCGPITRRQLEYEGEAMTKFISIGYGNEDGYRQTEPFVRDAAHKHDARLQADGVLMGVVGTPVQVRNPNNSGTETAEGPYLRADLPVAGFTVLEAVDLAHAIQLVSATPCAVANGVVEVWPLDTLSTR